MFVFNSTFDGKQRAGTCFRPETPNSSLPKNWMPPEFTAGTYRPVTATSPCSPGSPEAIGQAGSILGRQWAVPQAGASIAFPFATCGVGVQAHVGLDVQPFRRRLTKGRGSPNQFVLASIMEIRDARDRARPPFCKGGLGGGPGRAAVQIPATTLRSYFMIFKRTAMDMRTIQAGPGCRALGRSFPNANPVVAPMLGRPGCGWPCPPVPSGGSGGFSASRGKDRSVHSLAVRKYETGT